MITKLIFSFLNITSTPPIPEPESSGYEAHTFTVNGLSVKYRTAKITPAKAGQFVTIWKRKDKGPIEPFHVSDDLDLVIIGVQKGELLGQFVFPKAALVNKGIISTNSKEGKRGIRVYPPWDKTSSKQAAKTQQWQSEYFLEMKPDGTTDLARAQKLYQKIH